MTVKKTHNKKSELQGKFRKVKSVNPEKNRTTFLTKKHERKLVIAG